VISVPLHATKCEEAIYKSKRRSSVLDIQYRRADALENNS